MFDVFDFSWNHFVATLGYYANQDFKLSSGYTENVYIPGFYQRLGYM